MKTPIQNKSTLTSNMWDDVFDVTRLFSSPWMREMRDFGGVPAVNIQENEQEYLIECEVPGFSKKDIQITVENDVMTIAAKVEKNEEEQKKNYTRREFTSKSFSRSFQLPANAVKKDDIAAQYENGILKLQVPKVAQNQGSVSRTVEVK